MLPEPKVSVFFTEEDKINFHAWMDIYHPEIPLNCQHRVECDCGQCHKYFMRLYIEHIAKNN